MNSAQIDAALRSDRCTKYTFAGVFPSDALAILVKQLLPACYVVNLDPSSKPGSHWVCFYFPDNLADPAEYFDSYGQPVQKGAMERFWRKYGHKSCATSKKRLQGYFSTACGQYCIYYLTLRCRGYTMNEVCNFFTDSNYNWNDSMVVAFVNKHYRLNTIRTDYDFIVQRVLPYVRNFVV